MQQYFECVGLIPGSLAENEVQPVLEKVTGFFNKAEAEIVRNELIGRRKMTYPIKGMRHAYYFLVGFNSESQKVREIDKQLRLDSDIMRFLITKHAPKTPEQIKKEQERLARQAGEKLTKEEHKPYLGKSKLDADKTTESVFTETTTDKGGTYKAVTEKAEAKNSEPVDMEQLDKKLDEILNEEIKS